MNDKDVVETSPAAPSQPGDLGRRIRHKWEILELSPEETAHRAGMSVGYLEYLENRPVGLPTSNAVNRLAIALGTTVLDLLGGSVDKVPGRVPAARRPHLVALDSERSWILLGPRGVGRLVFNTDDGPIALPVNYAVTDHTILLRTDTKTAIAAIGSDERVSFEADHIDDAMSAGWSVLVLATCEHVGTSLNVESIFGIQVDPWAGGPREHWIRLRARSISGRAIQTRDDQR